MAPSPLEDSRVADLRGVGGVLLECLILQDYEGARLGAQLMKGLALTLGPDLDGAAAASRPRQVTAVVEGGASRIGFGGGYYG